MVFADSLELSKLLQDPAVMYAYEGPFTDKEVQKWLFKQIENYRKYSFGLWAVILKENNAFIGQCGLTKQTYARKDVLEVGYLFRKEFWHNGYATEAAIACKNYAFEIVGAHEVFSIIRDTNIASQNVAKRNGMTFAGKFIKEYRNVKMPHIVCSVKNNS